MLCSPSVAGSRWSYLALAALLVTLPACNLDYEVPEPSDASDSTDAARVTCETITCGGQSCCELDGAPVCVDTQTDPDHCGGCKEKCDKDEVCLLGSCREIDD